KYHVYRDDPALKGSGSYVATTSLATAVGAEGRVYFGSTTTVNDGGGGGGVVNPGQCVATDQWIGEKQAADVKPGDQVLCLDGDGYAPYPIESVEFSEQPCVELVTASGVRLVCSTSTPLTLRDGRIVSVLSASPGAEVPVLDAQGFRWEPLAAIQPAPPRRVAHIHVGGRTYAAGSEPGRFILTHNPVKP